jgi:hypothetical protein
MIFEIFAIISLAIAVGLTTSTIWSRKQTIARVIAVLLFLGLMPVLAGVGFFAMSHPAPWVQTLTVPGGKYTVLGVKMVQDEAIYVWLDFGGEYPRYFALPWDNETADRMQRLLDAQRRGEIPGFRLLIPYEKSLDTNPPQFQPLPQPKALPDKVPQQEPPTVYEREA